MTNKEINIAIAETCGWELGNCSLQQEWLRPSRKEHRTCVSSWVTVEGLPDYCNDLNAMWAAEACLTRDQQEECAYQLSEIVAPITGEPWKLMHSSAFSRAKAFLRTVGKWKEAQ